MAENLLLVKSQFELPSDDLTAVYTCPDRRTNTVTLFLCNRGAATTFNLAIALEGEADALKQYIYYGTPLPASNTLKLTFTLNEKDVIRVFVDAGGALTCSVFVDQSRPLRGR